MSNDPTWESFVTSYVSYIRTKGYVRTKIEDINGYENNSNVEARKINNSNVEARKTNNSNVDARKTNNSNIEARKTNKNKDKYCMITIVIRSFPTKIF